MNTHTALHIRTNERGCIEVANGTNRTVTLPCDVGDILFVITRQGDIAETKVRSFWIGLVSLQTTQHDLLMIRTTRWDIPVKDLGVKAFLTREEAEAASARK